MSHIEEPSAPVAENAELVALQEKLRVMQQIQTLQAQLTVGQTQPAAQVRNVKVPEGKYNMSMSEYRTYAKDCKSYQTLTSYDDRTVVLQMRLNMDDELKRSVDTNYAD